MAVPLLRDARTSLRWFRRDVQIVFQDPLSSLDPRMTVADIVAEPLVGLDVEGPRTSRRRGALRSASTRTRATATRTSSPVASSSASPSPERWRHIPKVLVADEPVSSLDVSVRAQILDLLSSLVERFGLTLVLVSHDLGVIHSLCDRVLVLHDGRVVEEGTTGEVFAAPVDPYTRLLAAVPRLP